MSTQPSHKPKGRPKKDAQPKVDTNAEPKPASNPKTLEDKKETSGKEVHQRKRRRPFDPYVPENFTNLQDLWRYRASLRKGRLRVDKKLQTVEDDNERAKLESNRHRYNQNLDVLSENHEELQTHLKYAMELTLVAEKSNDPEQAHVFDAWAKRFTNGLKSCSEPKTEN